MQSVRFGHFQLSDTLPKIKQLNRFKHILSNDSCLRYQPLLC